jgi:hypothetical protein
MAVVLRVDTTAGPRTTCTLISVGRAIATAECALLLRDVVVREQKVSDD